MANKKQKTKSKNIFDLGQIPKGIDSTLAVPSMFSKKIKGFDI